MAYEVLLTKEGLEKLKAELADLKGVTRARIAEAIKEAKSHGDLKENAAYHEAKLNQTRLESRIAELEKAVQYAKVVERADDHVGAHLGSTVSLEDLEFGDSFDVVLVGSFEADAKSSKISISSPLGEALVGKEAGAEVEIVAPDGIQKFRIAHVSN